MHFLQNIIFTSQLTFLPYLFIFLSFIVRMYSKTLNWAVFFLCYLSLSFVLDRITQIGIILSIGFFIIVYFSKVTTNSLYRYVCNFGILSWALLAKLHLLPGFHNWQIIVNEKITPDAIPYNLYFNFDTPIIGLVLYGIIRMGTTKLTELPHKLYDSRYIILSGVTTLILLSNLFGFINLNIKFPYFFVTWLMLNIITVATEEIIFRGWLLNLFLKKYSVRTSIVITSCFFGLLHFPGGATYILLSTIAGAYYSYIYLRTGSLGSSIFLHLLVNILHIIFFTYPALS